MMGLNVKLGGIGGKGNEKHPLTGNNYRKTCCYSRVTANVSTLVMLKVGMLGYWEYGGGVGKMDRGKNVSF